MIKFCTLSETSKENKTIEISVRDAAARYTDEKWTVTGFDRIEDIRKWMNTEPVLDYLSWDVTMNGSLTELATVRDSCPETFLIIVADSTISPLRYLKPQLSPRALILKPVCDENVKQVMKDIFEDAGMKRDQSSERMFLVETREEKRLIPFSRIDCFEAREKKIFVRTRSEEKGFYKSLDELAAVLPGYFIRCHRSFIVNMKRAASVSSMQRCIVMKDGMQVPYSRTCHAAVRRYMENEEQ